MEALKTLYKRSKNGKKVTEWTVGIDESGEFPAIVRISGFTDGKKTRKVKFVKKGTNIGKANEMSPLDQAYFQMGNMWQSKIEDNCVDNERDIDLPPTYIYPMLAATKNEKKYKFPCIAQPKMNGARLFSLRHLPEGDPRRDVRMFSRKLKHFDTVGHIHRAVDEVFGDFVNPDGEVYCHNEALQDQMSWLKKYQPGLTEKLEYWVYDLAMPGMTFIERLNWIDNNVPEDHPIIKQVPYVWIENAGQLKEQHDIWVEMGFEGLIIRDPDGLYGFNDRPVCLMKYKSFKDSEWDIIGFNHEEYHDPSTGDIWKLVLWRCITPDGIEFNCRPKGSYIKRRETYLVAQESVGKPLTIRYPDLTNDGVPQHGIGIVVRDYE